MRRKARADLDDIWDRGAKTWGHTKALSYLECLTGTLTLLADYPEIARLHAEFTPPVRLHPHRSYLIVCREDADRLEVIRILHGRMDWIAFLSE